VISIAECFSNCGIPKRSVAMIHGNAAVAMQFGIECISESLEKLTNDIVEYFSPEGTLVVPTFTYSLTEGETYNPKSSPSKVGQFSEIFRQDFRMERTLHPIFSTVVYGSKKDVFLNATIEDCFGPHTIFDAIFQLDGFIVLLGCGIDRATFVHYVEQAFNVNYRYMKIFKGQIACPAPTKIQTTYYVRNLEIASNTNLEKLRARAIAESKLKEANFGRFRVIAIRARDFYELGQKLLAEDPYSLIDQEDSKL